jgi:hypothetical protein
MRPSMAAWKPGPAPSFLQRHSGMNALAQSGVTAIQIGKTGMMAGNGVRREFERQSVKVVAHLSMRFGGI